MPHFPQGYHDSTPNGMALTLIGKWIPKAPKSGPRHLGGAKRLAVFGSSKRLALLNTPGENFVQQEPLKLQGVTSTCTSRATVDRGAKPPSPVTLVELEQLA